jgi:hypothetical protein
MWVYTIHGFYSVVSTPDDPTVVLVRARDKDSLTNLAAALATGEGQGEYTEETILTTPYRDYPYRTVMLRDDWVHYLEMYAYKDLVYSNFKQACEDAGMGFRKLDALGHVWYTMYSEWATRPAKEKNAWA